MTRLNVLATAVAEATELMMETNRQHSTEATAVANLPCQQKARKLNGSDEIRCGKSNSGHYDK